VASSLELIPIENQLMIYAERVIPVDRKLSLEEAIEFMIILEKQVIVIFLDKILLLLQMVFI
jgi:hypothetical protein